MTDFADSHLTVAFCGEEYSVGEAEEFVIGRDGDLAIDDNLYLHRHFLQILRREHLWWLANIGSQLSATVADEQGVLQAWLAPGASLPLVFPRTLVWFTAGPTTYEIEIALGHAPFVQVAPPETDAGQTTIGRTQFTPDQRLLVLALCEPVLRSGNRATADIPSSADAAARLGWTLTRFNRKLDNVCQKLARNGVQGLHGGPDRLALNRRARLVEFAIASRLVDRSDLALLEPR